MCSAFTARASRRRLGLGRTGLHKGRHDLAHRRRRRRVVRHVGRQVVRVHGRGRVRRRGRTRRVVARDVEPDRVVPCRVVVDAGRLQVATQARTLLLRYCANPRAGFWLRMVPPELVRRVAATFDDAIADCLRVTACARGARDDGCWRRALKQAQLPVRLGGLGLTSAERQADAAWCGSWALCWARLQRFFPTLRRGVPLGGPLLSDCLRRGLRSVWRPCGGGRACHPCRGGDRQHQ